MPKTLVDYDNPERSSGTYEEARKAAFTFAWEYFKYHAQQRQSAFRFYLVIVAALVASIVPAGTRVPFSAVGAALVIVSFLFWRLDKRNSSLVKLAEDYLKEEEMRLSSEVVSDKIMILARAEKRDSGVLRWTTSYSQVHRFLFVAISLFGISLAAPAGIQIGSWLLASFCAAASASGQISN